MILEYAQLLSTTQRILESPEAVEVYVWKNRKLIKKKAWHMHHTDTVRYRFGIIIIIKTEIYSATHHNHPCAVWVRSSKQHYTWLLKCFLGLLSMHLNHKTWRVVPQLCKIPDDLSTDLTCQPPMAMPDEFKRVNHKLAYQDYLNYKFKQWLNDNKRPATFDNPPEWLCTTLL